MIRFLNCHKSMLCSFQRFIWGLFSFDKELDKKICLELSTLIDFLPSKHYFNFGGEISMHHQWWSLRLIVISLWWAKSSKEEERHQRHPTTFWRLIRKEFLSHCPTVEMGIWVRSWQTKEITMKWESDSPLEQPSSSV